MKLAVLFLSLLTFGAVAAAEEFTIIGTVYSLTGNQISVKTPRGSFMIPADDRTETVKDKSYRDLSPLKIGDEISVRCRPDAAGKPVAVKIWAKVITFTATVKHVNGDEIEVVTIPNADYPKEEQRIVHFYPDTAFGTTKKDVTVGQSVRIVGLEVGNGTVDAARIALYNTDIPADRGRRK